jgi:predicted metal-binding membrane protein
MRSTSHVLGGLLLVAAGVYQLTPLKDACLGRCRSPIQFLTRHWKPGPAGALRVGLLHGAYCVGCCWALMGLLFVAGVMNLLWVAAMAVFVLMEKMTLLGTRFGRIASGTSLVVAGVVVLTVAWAR